MMMWRLGNFDVVGLSEQPIGTPKNSDDDEGYDVGDYPDQDVVGEN